MISLGNKISIEREIQARRKEWRCYSTLSIFKMKRCGDKDVCRLKVSQNLTHKINSC